MLHVLERLLETDHLQERLTVATQRSAAREQDQVERTVLVLVGELDGHLALTRARVVVRAQVAVSAMRDDDIDDDR